MPRPAPSFYLLTPPYRTLQPLSIDDPLPSRREDRRGSALVWRLSTPPAAPELAYARGRAPGVALVVILPPAETLDRPEEVLRVTELCRPHSILPHHQQPNVVDLQALLSRAPDDLSGDVTDYLVWRGLDVDLDSRRLIRKTLDLSSELCTVSGLARALYLSRRALGRRFTTKGLPVPSHWLHFGRVLRATLRLQDTKETLFAVAVSLGYPDGFALSNQMVRLTGVRPTIARHRLGWEWMLEEWLVQEARTGGFSRSVMTGVLGFERQASPSIAPSPPSTRAGARREATTLDKASEAPST